MYSKRFCFFSILKKCIIFGLSLYPRGESNPYLKFRKLLFYPLNYKGIYLNALQKYIFLLIIQSF